MDFPFTTAGTKAAIEHLKAQVNYVVRRGLCQDCLTAEPPAKRIRIQGAGVCADCMLKKSIF
jgi:hypothetical protein